MKQHVLIFRINLKFIYRKTYEINLLVLLSIDLNTFTVTRHNNCNSVIIDDMIINNN